MKAKQITKSVFVAIMAAFICLTTMVSVGNATYQEDSDTGQIKVKVRMKKVNGRYKRVKNAKVYLLSSDGKVVRKSKKAGSDGSVTFEGLEAGKTYRVACKKTGYVSRKNAAKKRYITRKLSVRASRTVSKTCDLTK